MADLRIEESQVSGLAGSTGSKRRQRRLLSLSISLFALVVFGFWRQVNSYVTREAVEAPFASNAAPAVAILTVRPPTGDREFVLPASVEPKTETAIYSRATGYLKRRLVDVGDHVKAGQLLAEVETPELDRQIQEIESQLQEMRANVTQSHAAIQQKQAQLDLAQATNDRISHLATEGIVARQAADEQRYTLLSRDADLAAAQAGARQTESRLLSVEARLNELRELKSFQQVRAPFEGVITVRKADVGSLLIPGTGTGTQELFHLVKAGQTRIVAQIPQEEARFLNPGAPCEIELGDPERTILPARIARSSRELDSVSRTLFVELALAAASDKVVPGMYVQARFRVPAAAGSGMLVPASAVIMRSGRAEAAVLDAADRVHFRKVMIGRDDGVNVDIVQGLVAGDRIVTTLSDAIQDDHPVRVMPPKANPK